MSNILNIVSVLNTKYPVSKEEAQVIYPTLEQSILSGVPVVVSFQGVENCAGIFISGLIGKLYDNYTSRVDQFITLRDIIKDENQIAYRIEKVKVNALRPAAAELADCLY